MKNCEIIHILVMQINLILLHKENLYRKHRNIEKSERLIHNFERIDLFNWITISQKVFKVVWFFEKFMILIFLIIFFLQMQFYYYISHKDRQSATKKSFSPLIGIESRNFRIYWIGLEHIPNIRNQILQGRCIQHFPNTHIFRKIYFSEEQERKKLISDVYSYFLTILIGRFHQIIWNP